MTARPAAAIRRLSVLGASSEANWYIRNANAPKSAIFSMPVRIRLHASIASLRPGRDSPIDSQKPANSLYLCIGPATSVKKLSW